MVGCFFFFKERNSYLRNVQDFLTDGKTPCERRFGEPYNGPVFPFGAMVRCLPISSRDLKDGAELGRPLRIEKNKNGNLETARRLRGIYFLDSEDGEYKKNHQTREETMEAAMPCKMEAKKRLKLRETASECDECNKIQKTKHALNLREGVWNPLYQKIMKITSHVKDTIRQVTAI